MPSALRAQVALIGLLGVLLIPIGTSSLRGLTHILTCREAVAATIAMSVDEDGVIVPTGSQVVSRESPEEAVPTLEVCGGLLVRYKVNAEQPDPGSSILTISITNMSDYGWRGSVALNMSGVSIPVEIGSVDSRETASDEVTLHLDRGKSYEIEGDLLIGP